MLTCRVNVVLAVTSSTCRLLAGRQAVTVTSSRLVVERATRHPSAHLPISKKQRQPIFPLLRRKREHESLQSEALCSGGRAHGE